MEEQRTLEGDFAQACRLIARHRALEQAMEMARLHAQTARTALDVFPETPEKSALRETIAFCTQREF
jgi:octaprenyl-diphosphate synthase